MEAETRHTHARVQSSPAAGVSTVLTPSRLPFPSPPCLLLVASRTFEVGVSVQDLGLVKQA